MSLLSTGLTGLSHATPLFLVAAALTLVFNATRLLDLGQAALAGFAAALASRLTLDPVLALVAVPVAAAALGAVLDRTLYRRLGRAPLMSQFLVMLGLFLMVHDAAEFVRTNVPPDLTWSQTSFTLGSLHLPIATPLVLVIGPAIFALLRLTPRDSQAWRSQFIVPTAAALSGLAGTLSTFAEPAALIGVDLNLFTGASLAVVLGGLGSLRGAFIAAIIVALVQAFTATLFQGAALAIPLAITAAFLLIRPTGLFGRALQAPAPRPPALLIRPAARSAQLLFIVALLLAVTAPVIMNSALPLLSGAAIAILFAASLHLLVGPGGIPSLGHAAFFGIGAAAAALFVQSTDSSLPMLATALVIGAGAAGLAGLLIGLVLARLSAPAIALLTLVVAQLVWTVVARPGLFHPMKPPSMPDFLRTAPPWFPPALGFWLILTICLGVALLLRRVIYAPFGYALRAARDDPARAAANGLPIALLRLTAFVIAGATAGLAGALTVVAIGASASTPTLDRSADALLMLALGGVQAIAAPLIGALAYSGAADLLPASPLWPFLLGPALIALSLLLPDGIAGASIRVWRRAA